MFALFQQFPAGGEGGGVGGGGGRGRRMSMRSQGFKITPPLFAFIKSIIHTPCLIFVVVLCKDNF
jgi:hypothetical protein